MEFISDYGLFLAKSLTVLFAIMAVVALLAGLKQRGQKQGKGHLEVRSLNDHYDSLSEPLAESLLSPNEKKHRLKKRRKDDKKRRKDKQGATEKKRLFVVSFHGDLRASATQSLREEITAILQYASPRDEVLVRLESSGGMVHSYGLAASQLDRVRKKGIPLTVAVDKVAASGGYMMACVADRIIAAPFAYIGSVGVVAQLPNVHRLLKKHDVDFEVLTAGDYKRTLTVFGENTEKGRQKFLQDLQETHDLFKQFIREHRATVDVDAIATGEVWLGTRAEQLGLVDEVLTSDEYIADQLNDVDAVEVTFAMKKSLPEKVGLVAEESADRMLLRWVKRLSGPRHFS